MDRLIERVIEGGRWLRLVVWALLGAFLLWLIVTGGRG